MADNDLTPEHCSLSPIERIPDDLLALFALFSFADSGTRGSIVFSHVSVAFRRVVLDQALLWTELSSSSHINQIKTSVDRSKNAGLQIRLYAREREHYSSEEICNFLDVVLQFSDRWEEFSICIPPYKPQYEPASTELLHIVQERCANLDLPRLEGLSLQNNWKSLWDTSGSAVYTIWKSAPLLRQLHFVNFAVRPSSLVNNITSLKLHYSERRSTLTREILTFLAATPLLQELSVIVHYLLVELRGDPLPQVFLPHLEHLLLRLNTTSIDSPMLSLIGIQSLTQSITMPNLRSHSSSYEFPAYQLHLLDQYDKIISNLIPDPTKHPLLKSINLAIFVTSVEYTRDRSWNEFPRFEFPLRKIPQVEWFSFASVLPFRFSSELDRKIKDKAFAPQLKHLTLTCPKLRGGELFELVDHLDIVGMLETLEGIDFVGCDGLTSREILKIVDAKEKKIRISA